MPSSHGHCMTPSATELCRATAVLAHEREKRKEGREKREEERERKGKDSGDDVGTTIFF